VDSSTLWVPLLAVVAFLGMVSILVRDWGGAVPVFIILIGVSGFLLLCALIPILFGDIRWSDNKDGLILISTVFVLSIAIAKILSKRI